MTICFLCHTMVFSSHQRRIIRQRAAEFAEKWSSKQRLREEEHSEVFIDEFFGVFDIDCHLSNIHFEYKLPGGRINVLWPGVILIENKSSNICLSEECRQQAVRYYEKLEDYLKSKYVLINNFHNFRIFSFKRRRGSKADYWDERRFSLKELPNNRNISLFYYFSDYRYIKITETMEEPAKGLIKHEIRKFMHKTKYRILKLAMVSSIFLALGYIISDGQPREYLERFIEGSTREESTR